MKPIWFLLLILPVLGCGENYTSTQGTEQGTERCSDSYADTDSGHDYGHQSYGLFVHWVWGGPPESEYGCRPTPYPDGSYPHTVDEAAGNFDVQRFVDDIAAMSPEYLIFTAWHCGMNPLYPSEVMKKWLGEGHSPQRDVLQELLDACDAKDIDVYFYTQPSEAHDFTRTPLMLAIIEVC